MCWSDNQWVHVAYYVAIFVLLLLILAFVTGEKFGEFKSALSNQDASFAAEKFSVTDWETSDLGTMLANFAPQSEHLRCPKNVDPLESQFMSKMSFLTARNPCK